jgi:transposase-like protein
MSVLNRPYFYDEAAAFDHVEAILWPQGPVCHHCGNMERIYSLKGVRSKPSKKHPEGVERHGLYKCGACRKQFTVRMGTIFEETHLPLHKWMQAIHLMCSSKKGISAHQLHRVLECTYKTAWFLAHRIREAMRSDDFSAMGGADKIVEADETFIGRLAGMPNTPPHGGGSQSYKNTVLPLVERGGKARSFHVDSTTVLQIVPIVNANIHRETILMTDEAKHYRGVGPEFAAHGRVNHGEKEYVLGIVHTNTVEGSIRSSSAA